MRVPNFLVIGAAKAGTTAVYDYLGDHPDIYMSPLKETNFLALEGHPLDFRGPGDAEYINKWSITTLDGYLAQFAGATTEAAVGEASPLYMYEPSTIERVRRHCPGVRFIAVLRHPVERAYSAFLHGIRDGREPLHDFGLALDAEEARIAAGWEHIWHYARMGLYGEQLERCHAAFGPDRVRAFLYEDLQCDPVGMLQECYRFLGVDGGHVPDMTIKPNVTAMLPREQRPPLTPEVRARLLAFFGEDVSRLERLIGRDLSHWREAGEGGDRYGVLHAGGADALAAGGVG